MDQGTGIIVVVSAIALFFAIIFLVPSCGPTDQQIEDACRKTIAESYEGVDIKGVSIDPYEAGEHECKAHVVFPGQTMPVRLEYKCSGDPLSCSVD